MSTFAIACIIFGCTLFGLACGVALRRWLPDHHTIDESKDIIKTAAGMMATLIALVIGLLVSSAKSSFDATNANITQAGTQLLALDRALSRYGVEAQPARAHLKRSAGVTIERLWPAEGTRPADMAGFENSTGMDELEAQIRALPAPDETRKELKSQALQLCAELMHARWLSIEETQNTLPNLFLIVLVFWLTVLFAGFGLLTPRNPTALMALPVSALSMSAAIFLIMELNRPLEGTIRASSGPLVKAVSLMGK